MANAVRVRVPPSAPVREQGLWQVAATLSFFLFRAALQAQPVPCFSCLYEFGSNRWYKRCLRCHPLPLLPLPRTEHITMFWMPTMFAYPAIFSGTVGKNIVTRHFPLQEEMKRMHHSDMTTDSPGNGVFPGLSDLSAFMLRDYDELLTEFCSCASLSSSSRISATGLNVTPRREGPEACSVPVAASSSLFFCTASPDGRR